MYPTRIDALTDGLVGVAMTILVLDVRLPESFDPDQSGLRSKGESLSRQYARWWLIGPGTDGYFP
jgi:uncharacterized membrane protein